MSALNLIKSYFALKLHDRYSRDMILKLQEKKFRKLLKYAYKNSKFYHELYSSKGINEDNIDTVDIEKIPIVDKDIIMKNFNDVVTVDDIDVKDLEVFIEESKDPNELYNGKYHVVHTSGTSGKLGIFVYNEKDWDSFAPYMIKAYDFKFKKFKTTFLGNVRGHSTGISFMSGAKKGITHFFCEPLILDINKPIKDTVKQLNEFQPDNLGGYFNGLKILAEQQEKGALKIKPKMIVNCSEGLNVKDKKYIEKVFKVPVANHYGFAECPVVGIGKDEYGGIFLMDDIALLEVKEDHILLTTLFNKTQPLIRYKIDDYIKIKENPNKKIPFTLIEDIIGRAEFVIWFENKDGEMDFIHPLYFADFHVQGLDKIQVVINDKKSFDLLVIIPGKNKKEVKKEIKRKIDELLVGKNFTNVKYEIKEVEKLESDKLSGKYRLIVKKGKK